MGRAGSFFLDFKKKFYVPLFRLAPPEATAQKKSKRARKEVEIWPQQWPFSPSKRPSPYCHWFHFLLQAKAVSLSLQGRAKCSMAPLPSPVTRRGKDGVKARGSRATAEKSQHPTLLAGKKIVAAPAPLPLPLPPPHRGGKRERDGCVFNKQSHRDPHFGRSCVHPTVAGLQFPSAMAEGQG